MKNLILTIAAMFITLSTNAMGFEQAREQALFLTDKMAYELNLTDDQYEAAYEINLDYLLGINNEADIFGIYWQNRNLDMSYILADWQFRAYCDALYFYRPIYWGSGYWHFRIFARYPRRTFFYFSSRPTFYVSYHGGHSWHQHGGSWYKDRHYGAAHRPGGDGRGMKDNFHNGTRNHGVGGTRNNGNAGFNRRSDNRNMNRENRGITRENNNINRENRGTTRGNINRESRSTTRENSTPNFQQRSSSTRTTVRQNNSTPVRSNSGSSYSGGSSSRGGSSYSSGGSSRSSSSNSGGGSRGTGGHSGSRR